MAAKIPAAITTHKQALAAFDAMEDARRLAMNARNYAGRYTPGTATNLKHWQRFERYDDMADAYGNLLRDWLCKASP